MNRIAIHYPEYRGKLRRIDNESRDLEDCTGTVKSAVRCLKELGDRGGYVWTQSLVSDNIKIGIVRSGTDIELCEAEWQVPDGHEQRRTGDRAVLKTLLLRDKLEDVHLGQAIGLRAGRLQQGTFVR